MDSPLSESHRWLDTETLGFPFPGASRSAGSRHQQGTYWVAPSGSEESLKDSWQRGKVWELSALQGDMGRQTRERAGPAGRVWPCDKDEDWQRMKVKSLCFIRRTVVLKLQGMCQVLWWSGERMQNQLTLRLLPTMLRCPAVPCPHRSGPPRPSEQQRATYSA